ncbi:MAG: glycoside hydrolase family 88 protein, partial [Bacteroidetes bacterium]|nr:glycoside hydrolase family 88 protein [Bacteroidota bacterium]
MFKKRILVKLALGFCILATKLDAQKPNNIPVEKIIALAKQQYHSYTEKYSDAELHLYSLQKDTTAATVTYKDWTSGFFPGCLWLLYEFTGEEEWKTNAEKWTRTLEPAKWLTNKHDLGFILYTSFGNGYRITGDSSYKNILEQGARSLSKRFNPVVGSIRSWDNGPWHYPVIADNLMNLELLLWSAQQFHDTSFLHIAISHIENDLKYRFRSDGSTFHVLDFDPSTGQLLAKKTWQGYSDSSCWARGQAWVIYALTRAYHYTNNTSYLIAAKNAANYFIRQINKIPDAIAYWDFNDPAIPAAERDVSAAAIAASALLELSHYDKQSQKEYYKTAVRILQSLCSDKYLATPATGNYFLLNHSVVNKPAGKGVDVPVIYAD